MSEGVPEDYQRWTDQQLIDFKARVKENPELRERLLTFMAVDYLLKTQLDVSLIRAKAEQEGASLVAYNLEDDEVPTEAEALVEAWEEDFQAAVNLPGAEWPQGMLGPETFSLFLRTMELPHG